jgi:catechol 2,3-dioxygenase-like lactoylglutathione lyase family enzyme
MLGGDCAQPGTGRSFEAPAFMARVNAVSTQCSLESLSLFIRAVGETAMAAQLRYLAFVAEDSEGLADFYARHFGFDVLGKSNQGDVSLSDGFYNLTFLRNRPSLDDPRIERGLHHFGFQVDNVADTTTRYVQQFPGNVVVSEPGGIHRGKRRFFDPECNSVVVSDGDFGVGERPRGRPRIAHIAMNALVPERLLVFYAGIFGMRELNTSFERRETGRLNRFAGDGVTNLAIHPFYNHSRGHEARMGINHFGILVDDMERKLDALAKEIRIAKRPEERPYAEYRLRDPEGNAFDLSQNKGWEVDVDVWDKAAA